MTRARPAMIAAGMGLVLSACDALPRDVDGSSERIARSHVVRIGVESGAADRSAQFVAALQGATGARADRRDGPLETLIADLDGDRIDILVARFRGDSALAGDIAIGPPLDGSTPRDGVTTLRPAVRNGENRLLMTIERVAARGSKR